MAKVAIIGGGQGGTSILRALDGVPSIQVVGICDVNSQAAGLMLARKLRIPDFTDINHVLALTDLDLIIEATGNAKVQEIINTKKRKEVAVVDSHGASLMMTLVEAREEMINQLHGHSITLSSSIQEISLVVQGMAESAVLISNNEHQLNANILEVLHLSEEITQVLEFIKQVADETKMLGLNAAIEAARAGEAGRGFGVVAEEIRKLSDQSKDTVTRIRGLIDEIKKKVDETVGNSQLTIDSIDQQAASTQQVSARVEDIVLMADQLKSLATGE